jgi:hypothetical protein
LDPPLYFLYGSLQVRAFLVHLLVVQVSMVVAFIYLLSYHLSFKARVVSILNLRLYYTSYLLLEFWNLFAPFVLLYLYDLGTLLA